MNKLQYVGYSALGTTLIATNTFAAIATDTQVINTGLKGTEKPLADAIQQGVKWFIGFLYIIAVCYGLYGGFLMMTAGGDEEKVKKGRTILIQVAIGLLVIFLASSVVSWVLSLLASTV